MSNENVEVVRETIARFNRDGFLPQEHYHPDVVLFNARESPLPGPYHGWDGLREWREGVFEVLEDGRFEIGELIDVDEAGIVVFTIRLLGRARHSGLDVDIAWTNVNWLRDGRIYRSESFTNRAEALEAAGLAEGA
jgi:ketosteroid isomerase-like protein